MRRFLARLAWALAIAGGVSLLWLWFVWPPPSWWRTHWPSETAFMRMRAGQYAAARNTTPRQYQPVPLDSITDWLEQAATVGEDDAFFRHHGVDWNALRQALGYRREAFDWSSPRDRAELQRALSRAYERRDRLRGASTITQQLAKNLYLSPSRNPLRKVKEAAIAFRLEGALTKERVLELYLNVAELGTNLWGVEAASRRYFQRGAARLTLEQAALLVATLPHPLTSNPAYRPGRTHWRQQFILRRLRGEAVLVPEEADEDTVPVPVVADAVVLRDSLARDSLVRDSLLPDSLRPGDSLPQAPPARDPAAAPTRDTTAVPSRPVPRP